ncbi:hypothetical protein [Kribbella rubisoli]|uniref:hypothetical protein n=1 Tax=Kribbella rubisoli TaxID=3075929 RepID=UPI00102C0C0C|nr:hypothetical protein [Kribbella rubisoli]
MTNWFADTFSSDASPEDLVKARSLNITRITGVAVPVLAGISVAIGELTDQPPFNDAGFQRQIALALVALIGVVATADILGRSIASRDSHSSVGTILPRTLPAKLVLDPDPGTHVKKDHRRAHCRVPKHQWLESRAMGRVPIRSG